jgi:hypothetical protein
MREHEEPRLAQPEDRLLTRRRFVEGVAVVATSAPLFAGTVSVASDQPPSAPQPIQRKLKLGIIGCGGRGAWIAGLFKENGGYEMHALADYFQDAVDKCGDDLGVDKRLTVDLTGLKV